jgi:outer membrane receptor protein involved in Fe transport
MGSHWALEGIMIKDRCNASVRRDSVRLRGLFCGVALIAVTTAGGAWAQSKDAGAADTGATVGELVVTAQKRSENIQTVPISMTALGEKTLQRLEIQSLQDISRQVPSLVVITAGPGENELIIRGISSTAGTTSTVGYYLDDTPLQPSSNAALLSQRGAIDPSLVDIERVEVLRGPQGTLYGSSSMGGTVKYVSFQPNLTKTEFKFGGEASGTDGGGPNATLNATANIPLIQDKLALRATVYDQYEGGWINRYPIDPNNYLGIAPGSKPKDDVNTDSNVGFRAQLRFQPDSTLSITPSIFYQYMRLGAPFQIDVPPGSLNNLIQARDVSEVQDQRSTVYNLAVHKTFNLFDLTSSTSYFEREVKLHEDSSKVIDYYFASPGGQNYVYPSYMIGEYQNKEFTQELRATSNLPGPFQIIAGGYFHRTFAPLFSSIPDPVGYDKAFGSPFGGEEFYAGVRKATLQETAVFSEASLQLGHGFTARAGVRWFDVDQRFFQSGDGIFNGGFSAVTNSSTDTGVNPKFSLEWQADATHMIYATASRGYRPGGPNNPAPAAVCGADVAALGLSSSQLVKYNPDTLWNYEVGAKTSWFDRKLTVNGDVYYIDWNQVQQQLTLNCGFNITANFGGAISKGAELEATFHPIRPLRLSGGLGYTDATLTAGIPGSGASAGDALQDVPHWNGSGTAEYTVELNDSLSGFALINGNFISDSHALYDKTSPYYLKKGFGLVNLKVGVDHGSQWEAAVFVNNLLNKIGETDLPTAISADLPTTRRFAINQPLTAGVSLHYKY